MNGTSITPEMIDQWTPAVAVVGFMIAVWLFGYWLVWRHAKKKG